MYSDFAGVYDRLMVDADYDGRTKLILDLFEKYDRLPTLALDLACGTGRFSVNMARKGISVIGVDISPEMLDIARENSEGLDILYLCQDAAQLDLYGTVDGAVCCLDSINHITDYEVLKKAFSKVSLFLEPQRLFIFDVNTVYKHKNVLADNVFVIDEDDIYCVWSNRFDEQTNISEITLDFFCENKDGLYERSGETIYERAYSEEEIETAIKEAGLEIVTVLDENGESDLKKDSERVIYVTRKV